MLKTEKIIYLPDTYIPTDNTRKISDKFITRKNQGLPQNGFVLCCFNNSYKITSEEFDIWMRLLKKIPKSVLWLRKSNEYSLNNFKEEAQKRGVDPTMNINAIKNFLMFFLENIPPKF